LNNVATLKELETVYTVDDVLRANAALDVQQSIDTIMSRVDDGK
jgi:hypothetical protein